MKILRLLSLAALAATLLVPQTVRAEDYPNRPITVVIPLGAGGSHDLHARGLTPILSKILGQPVIVSLVPGGAGMKGTTLVATCQAGRLHDYLHPQRVRPNNAANPQG